MRKILIILTISLVSSAAFADTVRIYDKYGSQTGTVKETFSGHNVYDSKGNMQGTFREQASGVMTYTDGFGNNQRTYVQSANGDRINVSDKYGNPVGTIRKTYDGGFQTYDSYGVSTENFRSQDGMHGTMYNNKGSVTRTFQTNY